MTEQEFVNWVMEQLPAIKDQTDKECTLSCVQCCYKDGFTKEDALAYTRFLEHVSPHLEEEYACRKMAAIAHKYRANKYPSSKS